jgi:hypothetical protein
VKVDIMGEGNQEKKGGDGPDDFILKGLAILLGCFFKITQ